MTFKEKVQVLQFLETDSERKAAEAFRNSRTCVNNIKKRKIEYLEQIKHENGKLCSKVRKPNNGDISKATLNLVHKMRVLNAHIWGPVIQKAAHKFIKEFEVQDFQTSSGWLDSFMNRNLNFTRENEWGIT
jgi:hypothetical protein